MKTVAIMQATYLPWVGYFGMMDAVDEFVLLDSVQFSRRSWQQRNRIKSPTGEVMLTVPVVRKGRRDQLIREVLLSPSGESLMSHLRSIQRCYRRAPYFEKYYAEISSLYSRSWTHLSQLNEALIRALRQWLGISTALLRSSDLPVCGKQAHLMLAICRACRATVYFAAEGSREYLTASGCFSGTEVELRYFEYKPVLYKQLYGEFIPYLSALDLLFNAGPDSRRIMLAGRVSP